MASWGSSGGGGPPGYSSGGFVGSGSGSGAANGASSGGFDLSSLPIVQKMNRVNIAHATLACIAWVLFFPLGSILLRSLHGPSTLWIHATIQMIAFFAFIAAVGMGIWLAIQFEDYMDIWSNAHPILGLVIFASVAFMPALGFVHHKIFARRGDGKRTAPGNLHVWLGRILIVLGIVNGGLGIRLAKESPMNDRTQQDKAAIAYGVVAGVMFVLYAGVSIWSEIRRGGKKRSQESRREKTDDLKVLHQVRRTASGPRAYEY